MKTVTAFANGRVNLIGEHTDYNDGWVFPTAIPQKTTVVLRAREGDLVSAKTSSPDHSPVEYRIGTEQKSDNWVDYIKGATKILRDDGFVIHGFQIDVDSNVPLGSGLSSSAALEVSVLKALREAFSLKMADEELAKIGQRIENEFVGARVGIMDQMACAMATFGEALFLDTKTLKSETVKIPLEDIDLVVINSGVAHRISGGGYNQRRAECESAARKLSVHSLREARLQDIEDSSALTPVEVKRARHVVTENARVHEAVAAMKAREYDRLGSLFLKSHASMRDDYEVSVPEIDMLVDLCRGHLSVYGARLTGGGFGGSIVAITRKNEGRRVAEDVTRAYHEKMKARATIVVPES